MTGAKSSIISAALRGRGYGFSNDLVTGEEPKGDTRL